MRICKVKTTDKIIEMQSNATEGTLLTNALNNGYAENEVEELVVTDEEFSSLMKIQDEAARTYADKRQLEYPDIYDYIDGVVKSDQAQRDKYIADCQAVKEKFPKT